MENHFSERERQVISLLLQGKGNKEIALGLGITIRTVEFHLSNIYAKLGVNSRTEAALKLSEGDLLKSTGAENETVLRDSTVEKRDDSMENHSKSISLWRKNMKNIFAFTLTGILLLVVILAGPFSSRNNIPNELPSVPAPTETQQPTLETTTVLLTPTTELPYEVLSPTQIRIDNTVFEVVANITPSILRFDVVGRFPPDSPCVPAEFPVTTTPECYLPPIVNDVQFSFPSPESFIELEPYGGGGGGGGGGDQDQGFYVGTGLAYHVINPISVGQRVQFNVIVTFNEFFGINQPVPFELDLMVESDE